MLDETASGVFTITCTPFKPDGALDLDSVDRMVSFYEDKGATGLTILGVMGEAPKLSAQEAILFIKHVMQRATVPVIVGVSSPGFAAMHSLAQEAMQLGAAGVMVAPAGNLRRDDAILAYFQNVAESLEDIPFVLQDFPLVTGVQIAPSVILKVIEHCPGCVMLKHEDWPGLEKITALRAASASGSRRISILCGNGGLFLPEELERGADGAMTGFAYPEMMTGVVEAMKRGDTEYARDLHDAYLPLMRYESQPGIGLAVRKYVLAQRGVIAHETVRKPSPKLSAATLAEVELILARQQKRLEALA